jgi:hypothetical protein
MALRLTSFDVRDLFNVGSCLLDQPWTVMRWRGGAVDDVAGRDRRRSGPGLCRVPSGRVGVARRAGAAVVLYDRSSESYLVDPYEPGPWTSQNHGPAGETFVNPNELVRLGAATSLIRSLRVARSGCRSALGWSTDRSGRHSRRVRASPGGAGHPPKQDGPPIAERSRPGPHPGGLPGPRAGEDHPRERGRCSRRNRPRPAFW